MVKRRRNYFNLSRNSKLTLKAGSLIPVFCEKVLPNDVIGGKLDMLVRVAPQVAPVLDGMKVKTYFFYCPTRLLDPQGEANYEDWFTHQGSVLINTDVAGNINDVRGYVGVDKKAKYFDDTNNIFTYDKYFFDKVNQNAFDTGLYGSRDQFYKTEVSLRQPGFNGYNGTRYGADGDSSALAEQINLNHLTNFFIPVKYPHFDVTLPKVWVSNDVTVPNVFNAMDQWKRSVPYRHFLSPFFTEIGSLADYFGICVGEGKWGDNINPFPFLMYRKVFNEFFCDPLKRDPLPEKLFTYKECYAPLFTPSSVTGINLTSGDRLESGGYNGETNTEAPMFYQEMTVVSQNRFSEIEAPIKSYHGGCIGIDSFTLPSTSSFSNSNEGFGGNISRFGYDETCLDEYFSKHHLKNCYPLIDPYFLGRTILSNGLYGYIRNFGSGVVSGGTAVSPSAASFSSMEKLPVPYYDFVRSSEFHLESALAPLNLYPETGNSYTRSNLSMNLNPLVFGNGYDYFTYFDQSSETVSNVTDRFTDSVLGPTGKRLAQNYSIFNDLLYKPAKRNVWNVCICDPSVFGTKFVVPVTSQGSSFDLDYGGSVDSEIKGLDLRELKVYSRIGLFFNYLAYTGEKYEDQLRMIYGTRPSDLRMKKPKFIGSGSSSIIFSEIINTAGGKKSSDANLQQGASTGYAFGVSKKHGFRYHAREEGYVLGVMVIEPRGRDFSARPHCLNVPKSYYDIPNPFIDGIGNSEVLVKDFCNSKFMGLYDPFYSRVVEHIPESHMISGYASDYDKSLYSGISTGSGLPVLNGSDIGYLGFASGDYIWNSSVPFAQSLVDDPITYLGDRDDLKSYLTSMSVNNFRKVSSYNNADFIERLAENCTFGYNKQFGEYRHAVPEIHGEYLIQKRNTHLSRFFNEYVPDLDRGNIFMNDNNHFGESKYVGLGSYRTDMLALDTYRYNAVDRIFDLASYEHPFWVDLNIKCGVSRILSKQGGISLI